MKRAITVILLFSMPMMWSVIYSKEATPAEEVIGNILDDSSGGKPADKQNQTTPRNEAQVDRSGAIRPKDRPEKKSTAGNTSGRDKRAKSTGEEAPSQISSEEQSLLKTGIDFYNGGMYEHSLKKLGELIVKYPQGAFKDSSHSWMGKAHMKLYRYDDAIKEFSAIPPDSGEYPTALFYTGESYLMKGDQISAIENFEKVYSRFPQSMLSDKALLNAGKLYLSQNKGAQALDSAVRLIKYYKDRDTIDDAYYLMAKVYEKDPGLKDVETARKIYRQFIKNGESDDRFGKSPLKKRVEEDLARIERTYFKLEK